jgi:hypothetical protein
MTGSQEAREVLGENHVFGPEDWLKYFPGKVSFTGEIPEIPWSREEIKNPGITEPHFLFLGAREFDGKPLNLATWYDLLKGPDYPRFEETQGTEEDVAQHTCEFRWYLMLVGNVKDSKGLPCDQQTAMLPREYELPSAIERVTANILYYLLNNEYLDPLFWARTRELKVSGGYSLRLSVFGGYDHMLRVRYFSGAALGDVTVAASRKLP